MRISHKHKFVFISKPKCATTSIRKALDPYTDIFSEQKLPYHHHVPACLLKQHFEEMGWDWNSYFKFASVRNPWDMLVSVYHYGKPDKKGFYFWQEKQYKPDTRMDFKTWINHGKSWDFKTKSHLNNLSAYSLPYYILDRDSKVIVDYIIQVENLAADLSYISEKLGLLLENHQLNKTSHKHYSDYYDEDDRKIVEKYFKDDIEFGNYSF